MDAVLANNEDFRRNDDLTELRQVVENVNCEMENTNAPMQQKAPPKGIFKDVVPQRRTLWTDFETINCYGNADSLFSSKIILATSLPRKDPLSFQNPSFHHVNINNNDLIPIHGVSNKVNENKKLFDDLEESNNYLQESLGYPKLNHKGECF